MSFIDRLEAKLFSKYSRWDYRMIDIPPEVFLPITGVSGTTYGGLGYWVALPYYGVCRLSLKHAGGRGVMIHVRTTGRHEFTRYADVADSTRVDQRLYQLLRGAA